MRKKLYISPEFEWLYINLLEDVLSASNPDLDKDDDNDMDGDNEGDTEPDSSEGYGGDGGDVDVGDLT